MSYFFSLNRLWPLAARRLDLGLGLREAVTMCVTGQ